LPGKSKEEKRYKGLTGNGSNRLGRDLPPVAPTRHPSTLVRAHGRIDLEAPLALLRFADDGSSNSSVSRFRLTLAVFFVLLFGSQPILAQSPSNESARIQSRMDEVARGLASQPRLKNVSEQKRQQLTEFVVGNMLFVFLHEMSHALVHEMEIPVLGREEDAADAFASLTMLKMGTKMSHRVLVEASKGWFLMQKRDQREGTQPDAYDSHGLDEQRAYQIVCFMVGSDKEMFKDLANETNLPEERQETCERDYKHASWSWEKSLQPHRRTAEQPRQQIEVTYWPGKGEFEVYEQAFRTIQILEMVANHAAETYVWPHSIGLEMATCGESAAQWQTSNRKLFLCYELAQEFAQLYRDYGQDWKTPPKEKWWQPKWWRAKEGQERKQ